MYQIVHLPKRVETQRDLQLKGCKSKYNGKVREVYHLENNTLVMVASRGFDM